MIQPPLPWSTERFAPIRQQVRRELRQHVILQQPAVSPANGDRRALGRLHAQRLRDLGVPAQHEDGRLVALALQGNTKFEKFCPEFCPILNFKEMEFGEHTTLYVKARAAMLFMQMR